MAEHSVEHLLVYGVDHAGSAVQWLTGWPVTKEAAVILTPGTQLVLLVQFYNHQPNAKDIARGVNVRWGGRSTLGSAVELLKARIAGGQQVGTIGPLPYDQFGLLSEFSPGLVNLDGPYSRLRMIKSQEEIDWFRIGAWLSDRSIDALRSELRPGLSERDLGAIVEAAYLPLGGTNLIHFFALTSMDNPDRCVPAQFPSTRTITAGDALSAEISGAFWRYPGQVLRTFAIGVEPNPLYQQLHSTAELAFAGIMERLRPGATLGEVTDAAAVIWDAGFTIYDDLLHGFDGGYLPPVVARPTRPPESPADFVFRAGMTVVVQPNVITADETAGVQTGELVLVTESGAESLHSSERGFIRVA